MNIQHLPPPFRDLWGELEEQRKESVDRHNREIWGSLEAIVDSRLASTVKVLSSVSDPFAPNLR